MIAVYLSPIYILWNVVQVWWLTRWMEESHTIFSVTWVKGTVIFFYVFLAASLGIEFLLPRSDIQRRIKKISNYWLGILLYLSLAVMGIILLGIVKQYPAVPQVGRIFSGRGFVVTGAIGLFLTLVLCVGGMVNARKIQVAKYEVDVKKTCGKIASLNVVLAADLHMGSNVGVAAIKNMTEKMNAQNPDLVVIAGDIFDNQYDALEDPDELIRILSGIKSKYGVYACYGNHDIEEPILAGFTFPDKKHKESDPRMDEFLEKAGIRLLREEGVLVEDAFYLYGRPDYEKPGRDIMKRKSPREVTAGMDKRKPILVMDHAPRELQELSQAGVDLDLCGHTHGGQMFPANVTTGLMWENAWGYLKKGNMHNIVTSGVGLFGPFMRVGSRAEICRIKVNFLE